MYSYFDLLSVIALSPSIPHGNPEFLRFFDHIVLPHSFGHIYKFTENGNEFGINWWINTGNVSKVERGTIKRTCRNLGKVGKGGR
jgi:hypothetical protein